MEVPRRLFSRLWFGDSRKNWGPRRRVERTSLDSPLVRDWDWESLRSDCLFVYLWIGCLCDAGGSVGRSCNPVTGACTCLRGVGGVKCNRFVDGLFCFPFSKLSEQTLCFQMHQLTFVTRRPCWSENIGFLPRSSSWHVWERNQEGKRRVFDPSGLDVATVWYKPMKVFHWFLFRSLSSITFDAPRFLFGSVRSFSVMLGLKWYTPSCTTSCIVLFWISNSFRFFFFWEVNLKRKNQTMSCNNFLVMAENKITLLIPSIMPAIGVGDDTV